MNNLSMLTSLWSVIGDLLTGLFAIIPQSIYFIFASAASFVDMMMFVIRKLVGLDVYYVNGEKQSGDILTHLIEGVLGINQEYSVLSTVFWAMIIFGVVLLVFATIISIIKSHYDYDTKKLTAMQIIGRAIKGLLTMVIIPLVTVFSLYLSEVVLKTLDTITTGSNEANFSKIYEADAMNKFAYSTKSKDEDEENIGKIYSSLDFFGSTEWSTMYSFSAAIFSAAAHNSNRVRQGGYTTVIGSENGYWSNLGIFYTDSETDAQERIATQIDTAFEYCLSLEEPQRVSIGGGDTIGLITSYSGLSAVFASGLFNIKSFSKFNVGLIFYYYNLWTFDWVLSFGGIISVVVLLFNLILGLIRRIFLLLVMFLIYPPVTALYPMDEGNAVKNWRQNFIKTFISSFSMIAALNIVMLILPFFKTISFFNSIILDSIMMALFTIAGLVVVKKVIKMLSELLGAESIEEAGGKLAKELGDVATKGIQATLKLMDVGVSAGKGGFGAPNLAMKLGKVANKATKNRKIRKKLGLKRGTKITDTERGKYNNIIRDEKISKKVEKNKNKYSELADAELGITAQGLDKNSAEYQAKKDAAMRSYAEDELDNKTIDSDFMDKNRDAIEQEKKAHEENYNELARGRLGMKYGWKEMQNLEKNDPEKYKKLFEEEKNKAAADVVKLNQDSKRANRRAKLKETGGELVNITGQTLKLLGDLTSISGLKDKFEKAGVIDQFKTQAQGYFKALGMENVASSDMFKTAGQKENEDKEKQKEARKELQKTADELKNKGTEAIIENLINNFQNYKTNVNTWNTCYDLAKKLLEKRGEKNVTVEKIKATVRKYNVDANKLRSELNAAKPKSPLNRKKELVKELLTLQGKMDSEITDDLITKTASGFTEKELEDEVKRLKEAKKDS